MSTIDYPDYFKSCAVQIRDACASPPAKRRFRAMLDEYLAECDRQTAARDAWERRRREHFEAVPLLGLDDPGAGPPGEGWRFEACDFDELLVEGWCPPELGWVSAPPAPTLLALAAEGPDLDGDCPADRALLLREKYAICAGIHDLVYSKLERLGPQDQPENRSAETFKAAVIWEVVLREVARLRDTDQVRVEAIVKDVVADLGGVEPDYQGVLEPAPTHNAAGEQPTPAIHDDSHLSPAKLAEVFGVSADPLRQRLDEWRKKTHEGWIENPDRGPREPRYLYRVGSVLPVIEALRAKNARV